jgi:hypothetical protein
MRVRNKLTGTTFVAELDLRRLSNQHADFVLLLHGVHGENTAMGRVAASLGCELVEWTSEDLAALVLAGFQMPRGEGQHPSLSQVNSLLQVARRRLPAPPNPQPSAAVSKRRIHGRGHQPRPDSVPRGNAHAAPDSSRHRERSHPSHSSRSAPRPTAAALVNG